jgi:beta-phosphoglucomutase family hydrolase
MNACVFDLDGTLVDNMAFHADAWLEMVKRLGLPPLSRETFEQKYAGRRNPEILPDLLGRALDPQEIERLAHEKESLYRELARATLAPMDGVVAFLEALASSGVQLAVASAAPAENRAFVLDGLGLRRFFSVVVGAEDVTRGKPWPDLFLGAARALNVEPSACVAFEDAVLGVQAAVAAGMRCLAVTSTTPADELVRAGAARTFASWRELDARVL